MGDSLYRTAGLGAMMAAAALLLAGCASTSKTPSDSPPATTAQPEDGPPDGSTAGQVADAASPVRLRVLEEHAAAEPLSAGSLGDEASPTLRYLSIDPSSAAMATIERTTTRPRFTSTRRGTSKPGQPEQVLSEQHLLVQPDGAVAVEEELVYDEDVQVVYQPPMTLLPADLQPGKPSVQKLRMTVHPLKDPKRVKSSGPVESTLTLVGRATLQVASGQVETVHIRHVFVAHLGPALVTNATDRWHAPGVGLVAEKRSERTTVAGLQIRSSGENWVLEALPGTGGAHGGDR